MKNIIQSFLLLGLSCLSVSVKAQWFNDDMENGTSGANMPQPYVNSSGACNPPGVTNGGLVITPISTGDAVWRSGNGSAISSSFSATAVTSSCTFTYTLNVTGGITITSASVDAFRSSGGAAVFSGFSINGTPYTISPNTSIANAWGTYTVTPSSPVVLGSGVYTVVMTHSSPVTATSTNWINRIDNFKISGTAAPVEMTRFDAKPTPSGVRLLWATATEHNNDYFAVEHSTDGQQFAEIAQVKGAGNVAVQQQYEYTDAKPAKGMNYYRLRQVDYGGRFDYSSVQSVKISSHSTTMLAPNPLQEGNNAILHYDSDNEADLNIAVFNHLGQLILSKQTGVEKGANNLPLDLSQLPKGVYALRLQTGTSLPDTKQVVVE